PYFIGLRRFSGCRVLWARAGPAGNISGLCAVARARSDRSIKYVDVVFVAGAGNTLHLGASGRSCVTLSGLCPLDSAPLSHRPLSESPDRQAADKTHAAQLSR